MNNHLLQSLHFTVSRCSYVRRFVIICAVAGETSERCLWKYKSCGMWCRCDCKI